MSQSEKYNEYEKQQAKVETLQAALEEERALLKKVAEEAAFERLAPLKVGDIIEVAYKRYKFAIINGAGFYDKEDGNMTKEAVPFCFAVKMNGEVTGEMIHPRYLQNPKKADKDCFVKKE